MPPATASHAFERLAEPFRRELQVHCYRLLGSLHEAEDLVQETYLRAWRTFDRFEGDAVRAWLYRIATNACLNALERRERAPRLLPDQLGPASGRVPLGAPATDLAWLEPHPDLDGAADAAPGPEARYSSREAVRLAFVATLQELPPRQRAVLMLCDVLGWAAGEAAVLLDASTASVTSALQRARETLSRRFPNGQRPAEQPPSEAQQRLLQRYLQAWEAHDADGLGALLKEDASLLMPPWRQWYRGREAIRSFFQERWTTCAGLRLVPTRANAQPAFAVYQQGADGRFAAHSLQVLALEGGEIATLTLFLEPGLVPAFGLPPVLPERVGSVR